MNKETVKKSIYSAIPIVIITLLTTLSVWLLFSRSSLSKEASIVVDKNKQLVVQINNLNKEVEDRSLQVQQLEKDIEEKKSTIIEKEKIIYKNGELIVPSDYVDLKRNYVTLSEISKTQRDVVARFEEKSNIDNLLIIDLSLALEKAKLQLLDSNDIILKKKFLVHSILLGSDFKSVDISYLILLKDMVYVGFGVSSNLNARAYIGVKL